MPEPKYPSLYTAAFTHPAIDNHAHPLLRSSARSVLPFEGLISEAAGTALTSDAPHTLACFRATKQLARLFGLGSDASWEDVKRHRDGMEYEELCELCFKDSGIETILIDDGIGGVKSMAEGYQWHDRFTKEKTRRVVRVEVEAAEIIKELFDAEIEKRRDRKKPEVMTMMRSLHKQLRIRLEKIVVEPDVVAFKSIVCYRTGLDVTAEQDFMDCSKELEREFNAYQQSGKIQLANKLLNDYVVTVALGIAGEHKKPVQFHTGLGDNAITLKLASPAHLQTVIKAFPSTTFVLLHSSYPFTREAGYLTAVYPNVYLDFGEVFPIVSGEGQRAIIRQVLELSPTNKIMWSSDGHWWPESFYLGILQAREALYEVLSEYVGRDELTEQEAVRIVENALYNTAQRLYSL